VKPESVTAARIRVKGNVTQMRPCPHDYGIMNPGKVHRNLTTACLYEFAIRNGEGMLAREGQLVINAAPHTGRSPSDKFIVDEPGSRDSISWGAVNRPLAAERFDALHRLLLAHLEGKELFVQDCFVGASRRHRLPIRVISEKAWHSLFARSMFIRLNDVEAETHRPEFTVISAPSFHARPLRDGVNSEVVILVNFAEKLILIGGTAYGGEIKKSIFTVMNYLMPRKGVLSMHCSANVGLKGDTALFFGLSGTGKTTLSADPDRALIGDDEHGWDEEGVFNFEGGCYAKVINLSRELEPEIHECVHHFGALLENVAIDPVTRKIDLNNASITENTRAAYPISAIRNSIPAGTGGHPKNILMLTCDAFGVLPPISRLTPEQAMYHFLSGYTAKIAGTEDGLGREPEATFSSCFGAPFLPLRPTVYAGLLREKIAGHDVACWLVNTGWSGGGFGTGSRIRIDHTRALINAALNGEFDGVPFVVEPFFGLSIPVACPGVPAEILNPRSAWSDKDGYDGTARRLVGNFHQNFRQFESLAGKEVASALSLTNLT
jgi:phosphoenolpyruvate carboxykinase (ATP)